LVISLIPTPKNSCLDVIFALINDAISVILFAGLVFQYETCSVTLNIEAKLGLEESDSKKIVASADRPPLNTFLTLRKVIQEEKVLNFSPVSLSNT